MYIQRSMTDNKRLSLQNLYEDMSPIFGYLSKVASDGLLNPGPNGLPRLVFDQEDMSRVASSDADSKLKENIILDFTCVHNNLLPNGKSQAFDIAG